jgi:hypothetical protein
MKSARKRLCWALGAAAVALSLNIFATTQDRTLGFYGKLSALVDSVASPCTARIPSFTLSCR